MIGRLRGIILEKQPPQLLLEVQGVGYEISAPMSTFYQLPDINQPVTLLTHLTVREDAHLLYGFYSEQERSLFRALIRVNGVGPKLALTILSGIEPAIFVQCIQDQDTTSLTGIPGIGKKTAERLIIETRDALSQWQVDHLESESNNETTPKQTGSNQRLQDAISALTALGYKPNEAKKAVTNVHAPEHDSEQLIRLALQQMMKGKAK